MTLAARRQAFDRLVTDRAAGDAEDLLDPDYALVLAHPATAVVPRARWIEMLPDYVVHEWTVEDETVDEDGDTAVALRRVAMRATVLGERRDGVFVLTDVWRRRGGVWRVWRRHSTPLSAGEMPGAPSSRP